MCMEQADDTGIIGVQDISIIISDNQIKLKNSEKQKQRVRINLGKLKPLRCWWEVYDQKVQLVSENYRLHGPALHQQPCTQLWGILVQFSLFGWHYGSVY